AANGYDVLTRAMAEAKDAVGALDGEFGTASGKLVNQVNRVKVAWENLVISIEDGSGIIGKSIVGVTGAFANLLNKMNELSATTSLEEFWLRVSSLSTAPIEFFLGTNATGEEADRVRRAVESQSVGANRNIDISGLFPSSSAYEYVQKAEKTITEEKTNQVKTAEQLAEEERKRAQALKDYQALQEKISRAQGDVYRDSLSNYDKVLYDIKKKYEGIYSVIGVSSEYGLLAKENEKAELLRANLERIIALTQKASSATVTPSGSLSVPTTLPGLAQAQERIGGLNTTATFDVELSKYLKSSLRRGVSQSLMGISDDIGKLTQDNYAIEQKYAELRANASADQISALRKMERLEKSINNGFTNLLTNAVGSISSIGSRTLSTAVGEGISSGDFSQLRGLFSGKNKAIGYGALGSLAGGAISGLTPKTSALGQGLGGALSGAGAGAAIGSVIPGIGTLVGGIVGGVVGLVGGIFGSSRAKKERELQELQLAEQRKQTA